MSDLLGRSRRAFDLRVGRCQRERTSCCIDFSRCGDLFREDVLGIHWRDSHPAVAA